MRRLGKAALILFVAALVFVAGAVVYVLWIDPKTLDENVELKKAVQVKEAELRNLKVEVETAQAETEAARRERQRALEGTRAVITSVVMRQAQRIGLPIEPQLGRVEPVGKELDAKKRQVASRLAIPVFAGQTLIGVISFSFNRKESPQAQGVFEPTELGLSDDAVRLLAAAIERFLGQRIQPDDWLVEVEWRLRSEGTRFRTLMIVSKDGTLTFEPILFFSLADSQISEPRRPPTPPGRTTVSWTGTIRNGLGLEAISWQAHLSYSWDRGHIIGDVAREFSPVAHLPLWYVDGTRTGIGISPKTMIRRGDRELETLLATFRLAWGTGFQQPLKLSVKGKASAGVEVPNLNTGGSAIERVYEADGDGRVIRPIP